MGTLILTILGLMVGLAYMGPSGDKIYFESTFLFLISFFGFSIFLAMWLSQAALRAFQRIGYRPRDFSAIFDPANADRAAMHMLIYRRFVRLRRMYWGATLLGYYIAINRFHLPRVIEHSDFLGLGDNTFSKILELAPFFLIAILALTLFFLVEQAFAVRKTRLGNYLKYHIRWMLIIIFPLTFLSFLSDVIRWYVFDYEALTFRYPTLEIGGTFIVFAFLFVFFPFVPRLIFRSEPIGDSPLRRRIEDLAEKMGVGYRDVRIWHTGAGGGATAFVAGPIAWSRYVFFSDTLVEGLSETEIEAVAAHEFAHAKRNHLFLYLGLIFGLSACATPFGAAAFLSALNIPRESIEAVQVITQIAAMIGILAIFAYLAKRFELEADVIGARAIGDFPRFILMLQKLAILNGVPPTAWSPVHFSIAKRMELLSRFRTDPFEAEKFLKFIRKARIGIGIFVALGIFALGFSGYSDFTESNVELLKRDYTYARDREYYSRSMDILEELAPHVTPSEAAGEFMYLGYRFLRANMLEHSYRAITTANELAPGNEEYGEQLRKVEKLIKSKSILPETQ